MLNESGSPNIPPRRATLLDVSIVGTEALLTVFTGYGSMLWFFVSFVQSNGHLFLVPGSPWDKKALVFAVFVPVIVMAFTVFFSVRLVVDNLTTFEQRRSIPFYGFADGRKFTSSASAIIALALALPIGAIVSYSHGIVPAFEFQKATFNASEVRAVPNEYPELYLGGCQVLSTSLTGTRGAVENVYIGSPGLLAEFLVLDSNNNLNNKTVATPAQISKLETFMSATVESIADAFDYKHTHGSLSNGDWSFHETMTGTPYNVSSAPLCMSELKQVLQYSLFPTCGGACDPLPGCQEECSNLEDKCGSLDRKSVV